MNNTTTELQELIDKISYIDKSTIPFDDGKIYYSNVDGSFLTRVGMESELKFLLKFGITEQVQDGYGEPKTACIGFNPIEQKWYGWSHRAIFGFGIGSECKKGNCGFIPSNKEEFINETLSFWGESEYSVETPIAIDKETGVLITYVYNDKVPNKSLRGTTYEHFVEYPKTYGKGEWKAETLDDARKMAIDFAKGVS